MHMYTLIAASRSVLPFFRPMTTNTSRNCRRPSASTMPNTILTSAFCHTSRVISCGASGPSWCRQYC